MIFLVGHNDSRRVGGRRRKRIGKVAWGNWGEKKKREEGKNKKGTLGLLFGL